MSLLEVRNLTVGFPGAVKGRYQIVLDGVSFDVQEGEIVGLVGESGAGKSMAAYAISKLLPQRARVLQGEILFKGENLLALSESEMRARIRGKQISLIFQDAMGTFSPVESIGAQMEEMTRLHRKDVRGDAVQELCLQLLREVHIPDAEQKYGQLVSTLSGGMAQRAALAMMALITKPRLLIADEPTTALDVTVEAQVLDLLVRIVREHHMGLLYITHDFGRIAEYADRVVLLKDGKVEETGEVHKFFAAPQSPYAKDVLGSLLRFEVPAPHTSQTGEQNAERMVRTEDAKVHFPFSRRTGLWSKMEGAVKAVDGVSFELYSGQALGIVGESGCGKTTLARALLGLNDLTYGSVQILGKEWRDTSAGGTLALRRAIQGVVQNPTQALTPTMRVRDLIAEGMRIHGLPAGMPRAEQEEWRAKKVLELLACVGLPQDYENEFPGRLSGGEQQRVALARALALEPRILVLDEPTASLDPSHKKQFVELLNDLRGRLGLTFVLITHELTVAAHLCTDVAVMYLGRIVETGSMRNVIENPLHPYTKALITSIPIPDPVAARQRPRIVLPDEVPSSANIPAGCRFHTRCPFADGDRCMREEPAWEEKEPGHWVACHYVEEIQQKIKSSV